MANKKALKEIKENNTAQVLRQILQAGEVSRIEIAESCDLSPSTVSQAVGALLSEGIVEEFSMGESTGGRKPVMLRIAAGYGCVTAVEIKRSGVDARVYDSGNHMLLEKKLASRMLTGNALLNVISNFLSSIQEGGEGVPSKVIGVGLLCQDDIPDYDLHTEFSTFLSTDVIRLEMALSSRCKVPVKKELINRYSLDYYLKCNGITCSNYAYVDIGERLTASFVVNNAQVKVNNGTVFDLSSFLFGKGFGPFANAAETQPSRNVARAQELAYQKLTPEEFSDKLVDILNSALMFFPVENIFIGGERDGIDRIIQHISKQSPINTAIRRSPVESGGAVGAFAHQLFMDNYKELIEG